MSAHAEAHDHHHGPPAANASSNVDARVLGMLMFIASEVMLFGSFFTAYFFVRVVNNYPWPPEGSVDSTSSHSPVTADLTGGNGCTATIRKRDPPGRRASARAIRKR